MRQRSMPGKNGGTSREEHPSCDTAALFGRRQDRIVLEGLRGEDSIAELCRRQGLSNLYYRWSKTSLKPERSDWLAI